MTITLTAGQQNAYEHFASFVTDPTQKVLVIEGYSGTGKSTLVKTLIERLPGLMEVARLLQPSLMNRTVVLTATTNKACEALSNLSGMSVATIHSFLELRVETNYKTMQTKLIPRTRNIKEDYLILIDEASYIDKELLGYIFNRTKDCKVVFIGDPSQLLTVGCWKAPVFCAGFPTVRLNEVMRHGGPILDMATAFRGTVETGNWPRFNPDGDVIRYVNRNDFEDAILAEFTRPDWKHNDSKVLAWTNKCVIRYNHAISDHVTGTPEFQPGDYGVVNRFLNMQGGVSLKTDETVVVTHVGPLTTEHGVLGNYLELNGRINVFMPKNPALKKAAIKEAHDQGQYQLVAYMDNNWIDLRAAYASTINKAQGSTYGTVFIDLDDIKRCNSGDQIARMMYVGVSRASKRVWLTGDLV